MKYLAHACAALTVLIATACGSLGSENHPMNQPDAATQQFQQLMQRPDIDQVTASYEDMYRKIREQITANFAELSWKETRPPSNTACGEQFGAIDVAGRMDAKESGLGNWTANGNLDDSQWMQASEEVRTIAQEHGFDAGRTTVNRPNDHEIVFFDRYGAELNFGSAVRTTLLLRTGCHLTPEAKQRGSLAPTPSY